MCSISRISIRLVLCVVVALLQACALPKNVAVTTTPLALGSVHRAKVEAIYPIFFPGGFSNERYSRASEDVGTLVGGALFNGLRHQAQLEQVSGSLSEAVSGAYEERYNGSLCQYFLETTDSTLIEMSEEDRGDDTFLEDLLRNELSDLTFEARNLSDQFTTAVFELEQSSRDLQDLLSLHSTEDAPEDFSRVRRELELQVEVTSNQVDTLRSLLNTNRKKLETLQRRLAVPEKAEATILSINNPCRNFEIGQIILVTAIPNNSEFILQPSF